MPFRSTNILGFATYLYLCLAFTLANADVTIPHGLFLNGGQNGVAQAALDHPDVAGMLVLSDWAAIEPTQGVFDWSVIDARVQQAADSNKLVRLALHAGGTGVPSWVDDMLDVNGGNISSIEATKRGETFTIPAFWDTDYLVHKTAFYQEMAQRYGTHPNVMALSVSMADPFTGDWAPHGVNAQTAADAGYNSIDFAGKWRDLVRTMMVGAPDKIISTAVGSMPQSLLNIVNPGEDRFFAFETAMALMAADPDIDMARLAGGKGSLNANTPDPSDPSLQIPDDLRDWQTIYNMIHSHGANAFGQTVWSVSFDPEFKMNGGTPYGGEGEPTKADIFLETAQIGNNYGLAWLEPWEIDILNTNEPGLQAAITQAANLFAAPTGDFDNDGDVDGNDFLAWQNGFGTVSGATRADGDADGNGTVDGNDFLIWQSNFGNAPSDNVALAVPEPSSLVLIVLGLAAALGLHQRAAGFTPSVFEAP